MHETSRTQQRPTVLQRKSAVRVKSLRGRGSCHSTCHRYVRLPVAAAPLPATAKCACHRTCHGYVRLPLDLPPPNAPATLPATAKCACHHTCHSYVRLPLESRHEAKLWLARRFGAARAIMDLKGGIKHKLCGK